MGGAQVAQPAAGAAALLYNPAALAGSTSQWSVGFSAGFHQLQIRLAERPDGYDIPDLEGDSPALPTSQQIPREDTDGVDPLYALTLGGATTVGSERIRVAAAVFLPTQSAVTMDTHFVDERERTSTNQLHFEFLDKRIRRLDLQFGGAFQATDWFSFGLGSVIVPAAMLNNDVTLQDPADQENSEINLHAESGAGLGWTSGALIELSEDLSFGASYRSEVVLEVTGTNRIFVLGTEGPDGEPQIVEQELSFVPSFTPARAAFGGRWRAGAWSTTLDAHLTRWSHYRDTHGAETNFDDTFGARLGGRWQATPNTAWMVGLGWEPSPVPEQSGRTNYVDNDRGIVSLGASHHLTIASRPVRIDWFARAHLLRARTEQKEIPEDPPNCGPGVEVLCDEVPDDLEDPRTGQTSPEAQGLQTGNPGFPGWTSGGWIGMLGFKLILEERAERSSPTSDAEVAP